MKRLLFILLVVALLCGAASADTTRSAVVIDIDEEKDILVLFDGAGLFWLWEGVEDFDYFDLVSFKLIGIGEDGISDDEMTQPIYSGIRVDKSWVIERVSEIDPELALRLLSK
jgi:hypothetical protein